MFEKGGRKGSMKKSKLSAGIMTGLLAVGALAACSKSGPEYNSKGVILTYEVNGKTIEYTADDLFVDNVNAEHAQEMFNQVYKLVVRNYFTIEDPDGKGTNTGSKQMADILSTAEKNVKIDKDTAEKNADTNGTSYKTEFEAILSSKGCEDEDELKEYYVFEEQQTKFKENFYKIYADENNGQESWKGYNLLRDGVSKDKEANDLKNPSGYSGYLETKVPYHISHILVNVDDGASTNYWNGTISSANAEHLKRVLDGLESTKSFGTVASEESDDGSKSSFGDLGIVDKDKATEESDKFVKEFILGLYTYDNLYNPDRFSTDEALKDRVKKSNIYPGDTIYQNMKTKYGTPSFIDRQDFIDLYDDREVEGSLVIGSSSANFYPRNIIYNDKFNNHGVSFITDSKGEGGANYKTLNIAGVDKKVLCAKGTNTPIIVTRAGASYQGIHFIVANRSPFEGTGDVMRDYTVDGVKLSQYYTTKYPGQAGYPTKTVDNKEVPLQTYVNTINSDKSKYKERAEKVAEEIKSFDSSIENFIYEQYIQGNLKFTEAGKAIGETIDSWIKRSRQEKVNNTYNSWVDYWTEYYDMLNMQHEQEDLKIKRGCGIAFKLASSKKNQEDVDLLKGNWSTQIASAYGTDAATAFNALGANDKSFDQIFNEIGGACNDGETHK